MSRISRASEASSSYHELPLVRFRQAVPIFFSATTLAVALAAEALGHPQDHLLHREQQRGPALSRYRDEAEIIALTPSERTLNGMMMLVR